MEKPRVIGKRPKQPKPTGIEKAIYKALVELGLNFQTEIGVRYSIYDRYYDFCVFGSEGEPLLFIEAHGEYFHPKKNPKEKLNKFQKRNVVNDRLKEFMLEELGVPLLVLWETEIEKDIEGCKKKIVEMLT